jgi:glycolate oxidase iron-sulfur subunit
MQTTLPASLKSTSQGQEADSILRSCVHCGFCLATCPTYQLLGDELDSPRGRIYLMKQMLEGEPVTADTQLHLDRCLTCRSCESTCPSGVQYGKLLDIGRAMIEERVERPPVSATMRYVLRKVLPHRRRFAVLYSLARLFKPLLPRAIQSKLPRQDSTPELSWPKPRHARKIILLEGCVQPTLTPGVNIAAARVLDKIGISVIRVPSAECCGAVAHHLSAHDDAHKQIKNNIDAMRPYVEAGAEAIAMTASACTAMLTDYAHILREDPIYAERAARVTALAKEMSQVILANQDALGKVLRKNAQAGPKVAFHSPCTLQHALKIRGSVESLLTAAGFTLTHVPDGHLCCGSAGTYSILQPELSQRLLAEKVAALEQGAPDIVATANIGCQTHIASGTTRPVRHWIELLDAHLAGRPL